MKKNYLLGMALMGSLAFYSCSNDNVPDGMGSGAETEDVQLINHSAGAERW